MSLLGKLFKTQADGVVNTIGTTLDNLITSDSERLKAKEAISSIVLDNLTKITEQQKEVLVTELQGTKLQRNWRPILMLSFGVIVVSNFFVLPLINVFLQSPELTQFITDFGNQESFWELLKLGMGGYVIGRSVEKVSDSVTKNIDMSFLKKKDREVK